MQAKLIRIGNSQGVRLSKTVIEQAHLGEELDIEVRGESVIIRPAHGARAGWADAAGACHDAGEDHCPEWDVAVGDDWA